MNSHTASGAAQTLEYLDQGHVLKMNDAAGTNVLWRYYYL